MGAGLTQRMGNDHTPTMPSRDGGTVLPPDVSPRFSEVRRPAQVFVVVWVALYAAAALRAWPQPHSPFLPLVAAIVAAVCLVSPLPSPRGGILAPTFFIITVIAVLWPPHDTLLTVGIGTMVGEILFYRVALWRALINGAGHALSAALAGFIAHVLLHHIRPGITSAIVAAAAVGIVYYVVNNTVIFRLLRAARYGTPPDIGIPFDWWIDLAYLPLVAAAALAAPSLSRLWGPLALTSVAAALTPLVGWTTARRLEHVLRARSAAALRHVASESSRGVPGFRTLPSFRTLRRPAQVFVVVGIAVYAMVVLWAWPQPHSPFLPLVAAIVAAVCLVPPTPQPRGGIMTYMLLPILVVGLVWPPQDAVLAIGSGMIVGQFFFYRIGIYRPLINGSANAVSLLISSLAAHQALAQVHPRALAVPLAALTILVLYSLINNTLIFGSMRALRYGTPLHIELRFSQPSTDWWLDLTCLPLGITALLVAPHVPGPWGLVGLTGAAAALTPVWRWMATWQYERLLEAREEAVIHTRHLEHEGPGLGSAVPTPAVFEGEGIALLSPDGICSYASPSARHALGYTHRQLIGHSWISLHHPEDRARALQIIASIVHTPHARAAAEVCVRHVAGSHVRVRTAYENCLRDPAIQAIILTFRDVTRELRAEETLEEQARRLRELSRQLVQAQETERRTMARELHDEIGQVLTGLTLTVDLARQQARGTETAATLDQVRSMVDSLQSKVRGMAVSLRPTVLDDHGLLSAMLMLCDEYRTTAALTTQVHHTGLNDRRFRPEVESSAYRVIQEALTNVVRHAGADTAVVRLWADETVLGVQVQDFGRGFVLEDALRAPRVRGVSGMRERVELLGGQFMIDSGPGEGTRVTAEIPLVIDGDATGGHQDSA